MKERRLAYMAHPVGAYGKHTIKSNLDRARLWLRWCIDTYPGHAIIAPYIDYCDVLDDENLAHRERGIEDVKVSLLRSDDLFLVGGFLSPGMTDEKLLSVENRLGVQDLLALGEYPPK